MLAPSPAIFRKSCLCVLLCTTLLAAPLSAQTSISIRAAGDEGTEQLDLVISGVNVAFYNVSTQFAVYNFVASGSVTADDIRIEFNNDVYDPDNGIDSNLQVDYIEVGGTRYQTEDTSVFSTGTWADPDGVVPGFGRGEYLHSNGYFQYASLGSRVTIRAAGDEGTEQFRLLIDGSVVGTYTVQTTLEDIIYDATEFLTPDQVRVEFFNDVYDPGNGIDSNLIVDYLQIDDTIVQTESLSVYSTGTWVDPDGVVGGFGRGEYLHSNGYFQFGVSESDSGVFQLESSVFRVNETTPLAEVKILRAEGSDTFATIDYQSLSDTAEDGLDFYAQTGTLAFDLGETFKSIFIPIVDDEIAEGQESFSFAIDNPRGAGLLAPRTATVTIDDDDAADPFPTFNDFSNVASLSLNGDAAQLGNVLALTDQVANQTGSAFYKTPIALDEETSFQTQFSFEMLGGTDGTEGLAFVIQSSPSGTSAIGSGNSGLGFEGVTNSLVVRFDTAQSEDETSNNFVAVSSNGQVAADASANVAFDLNSGSTYWAFVDYNGETEVLAIYLSNTQSKPLFPALITTVDLFGLVGVEAFVGLTAATSVVANEHSILDWFYQDTVPPPPNSPPANLNVEIVRTGLNKPTAIDFSPDGRNLYVAEQRGRIYVVRDGSSAGEALDMRDIVNGTRDRGLLDIAIHPDIEDFPYIYTLYTYDPPQVFQNASHNLAGPDKNGNRAARLSRWTLDSQTNYTRVIADSEVVLVGGNSTWNNFNAFANSTNDFDEPPAGILPDGSSLQDFIATDSESHTIGSVEFGTDGSLLISIGDGTSYNRVDPRSIRVQTIDNLSGKLLRIDPITGAGLPDNPFYNGDPDANRSKVYQMGLRNPFRVSVDSVTGNVFIGDVGWTAWEEINTGPAGANYGWPFYEGGDNGNLQTNRYRDLPEATAFYNSSVTVTEPTTALSHSRDGINAIVLGAVYRGTTYPTEYQGDLFFNDLGQGIVRHADIDAEGRVLSYQTFTSGAQIVVQIVQGPDGNLYFVDLNDGEVGRWVFE